MMKKYLNNLFVMAAILLLYACAPRQNLLTEADYLAVLLADDNMTFITNVDGEIYVGLKSTSRSLPASLKSRDNVTIVQSSEFKMYGDEIEPGDYPVFLPAVSNGLNMLIPDDFSRTDKWLPAWGGISIGHPDTTAGTNGGRICHLGDCNCFISNAHVMGGLEGAQIGDPIYQPGPHDGGTPEDVIGYIVAMAKPVKSKANLVDAAIACGDETTVYSKIYGLGTVTQVYADPQAGDKATKCGRTTGCTLATLISPDTFVKVGYYTSHSKLPQMYTFIHQMLFSGVSDPGDSGSMLVAGEWVITETQFGKWEALLFAGNEDNQIMANNPVYVLEALPGAYMPGTPAETSPYPAPGNSYP